MDCSVGITSANSYSSPSQSSALSQRSAGPYFSSIKTVISRSLKSFSPFSSLLFDRKSRSVLLHFMSPSHRVVFVKRWSFFVSAIWLMMFSGVSAFSNYSTALKEVLGLNQKELNRLSVAKDLGDSCGIVAGILSNYLPAWGLLCIGATVALVGFGTQWLVVSQIINPLPYWLMFILAAVAGNSVPWINTATFTTTVRNFPRNRGPVVGLFKAYMGLSTAVIARICDLVFSSSGSKYLLLQTILPSAFCIVAACFIQSVPPAETEEDETEEKWSLLLFSLTAACLAVCLVVLNIVPVETLVLKSVAMGILLVIGIAAPVFVPVYMFFGIKTSSSFYKQDLEEKEEFCGEEIDALETHPREGVDKQSVLRQALLNNPRVEQVRISTTDERSRGCCSSELVSELGEERRTLMLFRSWDFYVLYLSLFCGLGSGMTFNNNQGQIAQSLGFSTVTVFTTFSSLGNFFGRIISGNVSERFIRSAALPRPAWIGVAKLPMIAVFVWLSTGSGASMYASSVIVGMCFGSLITLTIPTVSEFYGLKAFGTNFMAANTAVLAGSALLSGVVAGYLYDLEADKEQSKGWWRRNWLASSSGTVTCYGSACYGKTLLILAGLLSFSLVLDILLVYTTRPLYKKLQWINSRLAQPTHNNLD